MYDVRLIAWTRAICLSIFSSQQLTTLPGCEQPFQAQEVLAPTLLSMMGDQHKWTKLGRTQQHDIPQHCCAWRLQQEAAQAGGGIEEDLLVAGQGRLQEEFFDAIEQEGATATKKEYKTKSSQLSFDNYKKALEEV